MLTFPEVLNLQRADFILATEWKESKDKEKWADCDVPKWIYDPTAQRIYLNDSKGVVRFKCLALAAASPLVHPVASLFAQCIALAKIVSFYPFWCEDLLEVDSNGKDFSIRITRYFVEVIRLIFAPLVVLMLCSSALYGIYAPYDGRKLYASWERFLYGGSLLAPCFQPDANSHLFRGDKDKSGQW